MICPNCGTELDESVDECFLCGYRIKRSPGAAAGAEAIRRSCPTCGFSLAADDIVCPICGTPIESEPPAEPEEQEALGTAPASVPAAMPEVEEEIRSSSKKRPVALICASLAVVLAVLVGVGIWYFQREPSTAATQPSEQASDAPTPSAAPTPTEVVSPSPSTDPAGGYTQADIIYVQTALTEMGYPGIAITGQMDSPTQMALSRFQANRELPADGYLSWSVMQEIQSALELWREEQAEPAVFCERCGRDCTNEGLINGICKECFYELAEPETPSPAAVTYAVTPYTIRLMSDYLPIYDGPGYEYQVVNEITDGGAYTIVEECISPEGYLWGKLKSGIGWINLDDTAYSISADAEPEKPIGYEILFTVEPGSFLASQGVQTGDIVTRVNGVRIYSQADAESVFSTLREGAAVTFTIALQSEDWQEIEVVETAR